MTCKACSGTGRYTYKDVKLVKCVCTTTKPHSLDEPPCTICNDTGHFPIQEQVMEPCPCCEGKGHNDLLESPPEPIYIEQEPPPIPPLPPDPFEKF